MGQGPRDSARASVFERHAKATIVVFLAVVLTALDFGSATAYRMVNGYSWSERGVERAKRLEQLYRVRSPIYHHDLAARVSTDSAVWGPRTYHVSTNSLGFKSNRVREIPLAAEGRRIVFIGDSYTEGVGVEYPETFVGIVDATLAPAGVEVLNAAVSSYSPIVYWRKIKHLIEDVGLEFDELIVFPDVSDAQDESIYYLDEDGNVQSPAVHWLGSGPTTADDDDDGSDKGGGGLGAWARRWLGRNSIVAFEVIRIAKDVLVDPKVAFSVNVPRSMWTIDPGLYEQFGKLGLDRMASYMDQLHALLSEHGIGLTVAVYPWPDQIIHNDLESIHVAFWRNWTADRNVRFVNYFPAFIKADNDRPSNERTLITYFFNDDTHWNEAGHRLIADGFLSEYRSGSTRTSADGGAPESAAAAGRLSESDRDR